MFSLPQVLRSLLSTHLRRTSGWLATAACVALLSASLNAAEDKRVGNVFIDEQGWQAEVNGESLYTGDDMLAAIQAAVDGLTSNRDWKERVDIHDTGNTGHGDGNGIRALDVPSYTILDFQGNTVHVDEDPERGVTPVRAQNADHIEVRNLNITGTPRHALFLKACHDVVLADIHISLRGQENPELRGGGIRTEGGDRPWSGRHNKDLVMENVHVEYTSGHGIELWRTDGFTADVITTRHTNYAGILLNQTRNVHIGLVDAYRANYGGGYAGFRVANDGGPNIVVDKVIAVDCGRGVFTVSGSRGITIHEVDISGSTSHGMLIEDTQNFVVNGGTIRYTGAEGVRINSREIGQGPGSDHKPASEVTVQNLRIFGCPYGIRETLPRSHDNRVLNNDLRGNDNGYEIQGEGSVAEGNIVD